MRHDILKYLRTVASSTAKMIAERIGVDRFDVARELNALHADGIVEREKRNGNEYAYWLSLVDDKLATAAQPNDPTPNAATTEIRIPLRDTPELAVVMLQNQIVDHNARHEADAAERLRIETERDELKVENESLKEGVAKLRENNAALEARIDALTIGPAGAKPIFVTVGRYCKPQRHDSLDAAQKRAGKLIRAEKESAILICEPLGQVIRGAQWQPRAPQSGQRGAQ